MSRIKHPFNMVEVALALLVISLGLSTVLTLFPAGLKATSEAENANNVVEAAEYIFAYLQTKVNEGSLAATNDETTEWKNFKTAAATDSKTYSVTTTGVRIEDKGNGVYVYHKAIANAGGSGYIEDFTCVARVLAAENGMESGTTSSAYVLPLPATTSSGADSTCTDDDGEKYYFKNLKQDENFYQSEKVSKVVKVVNVELSYPASIAYASREKRVFRMVLLNHYYQPHPESN